MLPTCSVLAFLVAACLAPGLASHAERRLVAKLLEGYDPNVRPVSAPADPVTVRTDIALNQILDLDERNEVLIANYWMRRQWHDTFLKWEPADYEGISSVRLSVTRIWRPDLTLYNDVSDQRKDLENVYPATVYNDGTVRWYTPELLSSSCSLDVTYFPWDRQSCQLVFGSWTYDGNSLDVTNKSHIGDMSVFALHGQWIFEDFPAERKVDYYPEPYPTVVYTVKLTRKPLYYVINMVLPCVFITFCGMLVFLLPPDSGEKVSLSVTVLLASTVFLLLVSEIMPPQSDVSPLVGKYFQSALFLLVLSTILTVVVLSAHHHGALATPPPGWVVSLVLRGLACAVGLSGQVRRQLGPGFGDSGDVDAKVHDITTTSDVLRLTDVEATKVAPAAANGNGKMTPAQRHIVVPSTAGGYRRPMSSAPPGTPIDRAERCRRQWMLIAMVLDRVFFIVFLLVTLITTTIILLDQGPRI